MQRTPQHSCPPLCAQIACSHSRARAFTADSLCRPSMNRRFDGQHGLSTKDSWEVKERAHEIAWKYNQRSVCRADSEHHSRGCRERCNAIFSNVAHEASMLSDVVASRKCVVSPVQRTFAFHQAALDKYTQSVRRLTLAHDTHGAKSAKQLDPDSRVLASRRK